VDTNAVIRGLNSLSGTDQRRLAAWMRGVSTGMLDGSNAGAVEGTLVTATEKGSDTIHKTTLACAAIGMGAVGDEAGQGQYASRKIYTFPKGLIAVLGATVKGNMTLTAPAIATWAGSVGLGVAALTDHQDASNKVGQILPAVAVTQAVLKVAAVKTLPAPAVLTESGGRWQDGTSTAIPLYLSLLITDNVLHDNTITGTFTGTITFAWINLNGV
jgi:hypothetical protein